MGQKRKVTVINLVSSQTIEHRMLSVLKFKSSMAAGVLDQGEDAIFMGESRFKKFMETVDELVMRPVAASDLPESTIGATEDPAMESPDETIAAGAEKEENVFPSEAIALKKEDSKALEPQALIRNGLDFLSGLSAALSNPGTTKQLVDSIISEDPSDGKTYLKIPIESRQTVENIIGLLGTLFQEKND
jgi:hypothetical protein